MFDIVLNELNSIKGLLTALAVLFLLKLIFLNGLGHVLKMEISNSKVIALVEVIIVFVLVCCVLGQELHLIVSHGGPSDIMAFVFCLIGFGSFSLILLFLNNKYGK